ncbi:MAG: PDZ domain-containing protein [Planctomycetes bacterium]|nr:PDZ domain-containing protein [Planctomycetota bacterium]
MMHKFENGRVNLPMDDSQLHSVSGTNCCRPSVENPSHRVARTQSVRNTLGRWIQSLGWMIGQGTLVMPVAMLPVSMLIVVSLLTGMLDAAPPLSELEQAAFQAATLYSQDSVVQVETFGGSELVNQQLAATGPSTGTVLSPDGWIVTSTFQFRGQPASITVVLPDQQRKPAKLVARDLSRELALLKIDVDSPLKPIAVSDRSGWQVGEWVMALGKTFDPQSASCSVGILSATGRVWNKAIQTDAKISPQNYGGPVIDLRGRAMGILTPLNPGIVTEGEVEQWYDSGIGFAIPIQDILDRLPRMQQGEDIHPGRIGFRWRGNNEYSEPVVLQGVTPGSPAAKAGIMTGDKIIALGSSPERLQPIENHSQLKHILGPLDAGQTMAIVVDRKGERKSFECQLIKELPTYREPYLGVLVEPIPLEKNGASGTGPRISGLIPESPAKESGLSVGDEILEIGGEVVDTAHPIESRLASKDYRERVILNVRGTDQTERTVDLQLKSRPEIDLEWDYRPTLPEAGKIADPKDANQGKETSKGTVQLPLGDVKNKAFAIVPTNYRQDIPHGLLVLFGEAGVQNQTQWSNAWDVFVREHRWIVAVAQSADEKGWSFDEIEIGQRLQSYMTQNYNIDRRRIAFGGVESGSLLAYITTVQNPELVRGVWLCNPKLPQQIRIQPCEPFKAIQFFVNGKEKTLDRFVEVARGAGYSVQRSSTEVEVAKISESPVLGPLQRWLRLLEAY